MAEHNWKEEIRVQGEQLVDEVKKLVHEGNVRHIVIRHEGQVVLEFPVTAGVVGVLLAPTFAALAAVGAALTHCAVEVIRTSPGDDR